MADARVATAWARVFAAALARAGLREVAIAPGSRSTPLVMAFARESRLGLRVHLDERSCAFFALGLGKASGAPAAVLTTSGTAVANLYPAIVEAAKAETPLIVLTADRPHHLRDADANQAIDQIRPFGRYPLASWEVAPPSTHPPALRHLEGLAHRAQAVASGPPAGPVHLNFPFDKPFDPPPDPPSSEGRDPLLASGSGGSPLACVEAGRLAARPQVIDRLGRALTGSRRGVLVAGPSPDPVRLGSAVSTFAKAIGTPVLADPLSGARYGVAAPRISRYDLYLGDPAVGDALKPDLIVRVGASPTSAALLGWLERHRSVRQVVIDGGRSWKDHAAAATDYLRADAADTLLALARRPASPARVPKPGAEWRALWIAADEAAGKALARANRKEPHEGRIAARLVDRLPAGASLVASNSMPVRDLDAFGGTRPEPFAAFGNRGASGIDGVVSTAFGVAAATRGPTVCLIGDVAFFHDQNGLLWSRESDAPVVFVLADNDGGGIFHGLPIAEREPHFTRYFATPHGSDLSRACAMHGVATRTVGIRDLDRELDRALETEETVVLRIPLDRALDHSRRKRAAAAAADAVRDVLVRKTDP